MGLEGGEATHGSGHEGANGSGVVVEGANDRVEETVVGGGSEGGGTYESYLWGCGAEDDGGGVDHGGVTQFEFDRLRDYRFEQFLDMTVKGEGHDTVGAVVIYVKS
jgi:hypothetical protein